MWYSHGSEVLSSVMHVEKSLWSIKTTTSLLKCNTCWEPCDWSRVQAFFSSVMHVQNAGICQGEQAMSNIMYNAHFAWFWKGWIFCGKRYLDVKCKPLLLQEVFKNNHGKNQKICYVWAFPYVSQFVHENST